MATYTPKINTNKWFPDKSDLVAWVYDITKYLQDTPIPTEEAVAQAVDKYLQENPITGNFYSPENPPPYPVTSVNGKTGDVIIEGGGTGNAYSPDNPPPYPVTSVNGKTGAVTGLYSADNAPPYPVTSVNGKTGAVQVDVDTSGLYSPTNPPPYPVTSVNGKTGAVEIATGGLSVSNANSTIPSDNNTSNVTLTLDGYVTGKYKMIFVMFVCKSDNYDASIKVQTGNGRTIMSCVSDADGGTYSAFADGICCYPTALYDGNIIRLVANKPDAEIYTAQVDNFWWGVE